MLTRKTAPIRMRACSMEDVLTPSFASAVGTREIGGQFFGVPIVTQSVVTKAHQVISKEKAADGGVNLQIRMEHRLYVFPEVKGHV